VAMMYISLTVLSGIENVSDVIVENSMIAKQAAT